MSQPLTPQTVNSAFSLSAIKSVLYEDSPQYAWARAAYDEASLLLNNSDPYSDEMQFLLEALADSVKKVISLSQDATFEQVVSAANEAYQARKGAIFEQYEKVFNQVAARAEFYSLLGYDNSLDVLPIEADDDYGVYRLRLSNGLQGADEYTGQTAQELLENAINAPFFAQSYHQTTRVLALAKIIKDKENIEIVVQANPQVKEGSEDNYQIVASSSDKGAVPVVLDIKASLNGAQVALDAYEDYYKEQYGRWLAQNAISVRGGINAKRTSENGQSWVAAGDASVRDFVNMFAFESDEVIRVKSDDTDERVVQQSLNNHLESLMDLAESLNIMPYAISLNGHLKVVFNDKLPNPSADNAYFDKNTGILNLSLGQGRGAIANQWFRALNHFIEKEVLANSERDHLVNLSILKLMADDDLTEHTLNKYQKDLRLTNRTRAGLPSVDFQDGERMLDIGAQRFEAAVEENLKEHAGISNPHLVNVMEEKAWNAAPYYDPKSNFEHAVISLFSLSNQNHAYQYPVEEAQKKENNNLMSLAISALKDSHPLFKENFNSVHEDGDWEWDRVRQTNPIREHFNQFESPK